MKGRSVFLDNFLKQQYEEGIKAATDYKKEKVTVAQFENTLSPINSHISTVKNNIQDIQDTISILNNRIAVLERTAADHCGIPKRPRRKLTIKVSA